MQLIQQAIINAPAEDVWSLVAHEFDRVGSWAASVPVSQWAANAAAPSGCPVGARTCRTTMRMFPAVEEHLVAYDEDGETLAYEAVRGLPRFVARARDT